MHAYYQTAHVLPIQISSRRHEKEPRWQPNVINNNKSGRKPLLRQTLYCWPKINWLNQKVLYKTNNEWFSSCDSKNISFVERLNLFHSTRLRLVEWNKFNLSTHEIFLLSHSKPFINKIQITEIGSWARNLHYHENDTENIQNSKISQNPEFSAEY